MLTIGKQWYRIKSAYPDALVCFEIGAFIEYIALDAYVAHEVLGIKLTARAMGGGKYALLCGYPSNIRQKFETKLLNAGYDLVIVAEQSYDEANAQLKARHVDRIKTVKEASKKSPQDKQQAYDVYKEKHLSQLIVKEKAESKQKKQDVLAQIKGLNLKRLTGYEALTLLHRWQKEMRQNK